MGTLGAIIFIIMLVYFILTGGGDNHSGQNGH